MVKLFSSLWQIDFTKPDSHYQDTFHQSQLELSGNMWFNFVEMKTPNIPLQGDFQPSIYNERERRRGDAAHPGFDFL